MMTAREAHIATMDKHLPFIEEWKTKIIKKSAILDVLGELSSK